MRKNEKKWEQSQGKNEKKYDKDPSHFMTTLSYFSHFFSFFLIFSHFDSQQLWPKHVMRKNEKKWEKIRYKFVKDQSNFSACGALLELVLKKKIPPAAGLDFPRLYFEKNFPACGGLGISPTLLIIRIEWSLKKNFPPAGGSEFPACGGLLNFRSNWIEVWKKFSRLRRPFEIWKKKSRLRWTF